MAHRRFSWLRLGAVACSLVAVAACSSSSASSSDAKVHCTKRNVNNVCSCSADLEYITGGEYTEQSTCTTSSGGVCCQLDEKHCQCDPGASTCAAPGRKITECTATSGSGFTATCDDVGYCGLTTDMCACSTSCVHYGAGEYLCGHTCSSDADCKGVTDPVSGAAHTKCTPGNDGYDGFCSG